ncbi:MAG TPA: hypothetical protein VJ927_00150 [Actinomycetota bacterium]|nr:hypothetical protein [Actinomycetota bacterium]
MKKTLATAVALLLLGAAVPASAGKAKKKSKPQVVEGSIVVPQPGAAAGPCIYRTQRTMAIAGGPNGVVGYTFEVDPKTVGKPFKLEVADGAGMDIQFYSELGDATDPTTAPANMGFETPGPGGEEGTVPPGMPIVFVCMNEGANSSFTYTAG